MKKFNFKIFCLTFIFSILFFSLPSYADKAEPQEIFSICKRIINYEKSSYDLSEKDFLFNNEFLKKADDETSIKFLIAESRLGIPDNYSAYSYILRDIAERSYVSTDNQKSSKVSYWHRLCMGLFASGTNPQDILTKKGNADLIEYSVWNREKAKPIEKEGVEALLSSLIVLDAYDTIIPQDTSVNYTREKLIEKILSYQLPDGTFQAVSLKSQPEIVAQFICTLAPYKDIEAEFNYTTFAKNEKQHQTIGNALSKSIEFLSNSRSVTGDYSSYPKDNIKILSKVIIGLTALGIDPNEDERFLRDDVSLIDFLIFEQNPDGSVSESPDESIKRSDSACALEAFTAYYRFITEKTRYFDFTDTALNQKKRSLKIPDLKSVAEYFIYNPGLTSCDDYPKLASYLSEAENADLTPENQIYYMLLSEKLSELYNKSIKIYNLNEQGKILANPQTVFGSKNLHEVKIFLNSYDALNDSEKELITSYEAVVNKKSSLKSRSSIVYIFVIVVGIILIALILFFAVFFIRSTPLWEYLYMRFVGKRGAFEIYQDGYEDDDDYIDPFYDEFGTPKIDNKE